MRLVLRVRLCNWWQHCDWWPTGGKFLTGVSGHARHRWKMQAELPSRGHKGSDADYRSGIFTLHGERHLRLRVASHLTVASTVARTLDSC